MTISKIVLTGGPCAGKTTAFAQIQEAFEKKYAVLFVAETATELINSGFAPATCQSETEFQRNLLRLQIEKEKVYEQAARAMNKENVLIVYDRGVLDNKAYMDEADFAAMVDSLGTTEKELRDNYDAVFHLVTTAKGAVEFYTTANNTARTEKPEKAAALDDNLIAAWSDHPHHHVIDNSTDFDEKMTRLIKEMSAFLGDPNPCEIERKYLIAYPDMQWLESYPSRRRIDIIQTYLRSTEDEEIRVRQRGVDGHYVYYQTIKRKISNLKRIETERRLSQEEYLNLLREADPTKRPIHKTRYCLTYEKQYFEIDVYPFWSDQAIAEIELPTEDTPVCFPEQIRVIREVTDDVSFKNASLAQIP